MNNCVAVILAAGKGTRMMSTKPKVLHEIGGRPILGHVLETALECCHDVVVIYGHAGDEVKASFRDYECQWVEQKEQLGTGHAVKQALPHIDAKERVVILSGDVPLLRPSTLQSFLDAVPEDALGLVTVHANDPAGLGRIIRNTEGNIEAIVEEKDASEKEKLITEINAGIYVCNKATLSAHLDKINQDNTQNEYYLTDVVQIALETGQQVVGFMADETETLGINTRLQWLLAARQYQKRQACDLVERGVWVRDVNRLDVRGELQCEDNVEIDINVIIEGYVQLGKDVKVGANCVLKNVKVGAGTVIKPNSVIEDSTIGEKCLIGPFARVRPETVLDDFVKLGNFVETKKTIMRKGSKLNHLSYLGDAEVGEYANVGAGTITCNYDGVNKHQTKIGDYAFVGSNTSLIAPVSIGGGATVGAGSVISRDAPPEQLTLSRPPQRTIESWNRKEKHKKGDA